MTQGVFGRTLREIGTKTGKQWKWKGDDHTPGIELYLTGRYFAVTDQQHPDAPAKLRHVPVTLMLRLIREIGPACLAEVIAHLPLTLE